MVTSEEHRLRQDSRPKEAIAGVAPDQAASIFASVDKPVSPARRKRERLRHVRWVMLAVAAIGAGAWALRFSGIPSVARADITVAAVDAGALITEVPASGSLAARTARWVIAEAGGMVERIPVESGSPTRRDTPIVVLRNDDVRDQASTARSRLAAAAAELQAKDADLRDETLRQKAAEAQIAADLEIAKARLATESKLIGVGMTSKLQYEESKVKARVLEERLAIEHERTQAMVDSTYSRLAMLREQIVQLKANAERQAELFKSLQPTAGMSGVVQQVAVEVGQQVASGTKLARIADPDDLFAKLFVIESSARYLKAGQAVSVDIKPVKLSGKITRIDAAVQGGTVQVDVELPKPLPESARLDLAVDGTIAVDAAASTLKVRIPYGAQPFTTKRVFVLDDTRKMARQKTVRFGRASTTEIEILDGAGRGQSLIVSDTDKYADFDALQLQ